MQHGMSIVDMFLQAGLVGRAVMIALVLSSLWCWTIILEGLWSLRLVRSALKGKANRFAPRLDGIFARGRKEAALHLSAETLADRRSRIVNAMKRAAQEELELAQGGLSNLATIASVAPFVGLFGTVWGIMNSFTSIADSKDTSLAVVAPGIAEALAATAIGLAAAIPAAFAYNKLKGGFSSAGRALNRRIEDESTAIEAHSKESPAKPALLREAGE